MTSLNGNIFRVTDPLWGETNDHRWIPLTKASDVELWGFLWWAPEQMTEQTFESWDAIPLIVMSVSRRSEQKPSQRANGKTFANILMQIFRPI